MAPLVQKMNCRVMAPACSHFILPYCRSSSEQCDDLDKMSVLCSVFSLRQNRLVSKITVENWRSLMLILFTASIIFTILPTKTWLAPWPQTAAQVHFGG